MGIVWAIRKGKLENARGHPTTDTAKQIRDSNDKQRQPRNDGGGNEEEKDAEDGRRKGGRMGKR